MSCDTLPARIDAPADAPSLMRLAIAAGADVPTLERLFELQLRADAETARRGFVAAMAAFKAQAPRLVKNRAVDYQGKSGRIRYTHVTLASVVDTVVPVLGEHGLSATWTATQDRGTVAVTCHLTHSLGHRESVTLAGPVDDSAGKNAVQQIGSTVTYLSRYTLLSALGLAALDQDDADDEPGRRQPADPKTPEKLRPVTERMVTDAKQGMGRAAMLICVTTWLDDAGLCAGDLQAFASHKAGQELAPVDGWPDARLAKCLAALGGTYGRDLIEWSSQRAIDALGRDPRPDPMDVDPTPEPDELPA